MDSIDVPSLLDAFKTLQDENSRLTQRNLLLEARIREMEQNGNPSPNRSVPSAGHVILPNGEIGSDPQQFQFSSNMPSALNNSIGNRGDGGAYIDEISSGEIDDSVGNTEDPAPQHNNCVFQGPHPFLQEPVLTVLSQFLDHRSLGTGRSVCTYWNQILTFIFKKRSEMNLDLSSSSTEKIEAFSGKLFSAYPISEFNAQMNLATCLPLTISLIIDPLNQPRGTELLQMWLVKFGNEIKDITITLGNEEIYISAALLTQIINACPNVEKLRTSDFLLHGSLNEIEPTLFQNITTLDFELIWTVLRFPMIDQYITYGLEVIESMKDILQSVPNLRTLRLTPVQVAMPHLQARLVECIAVCQNTGCIENLLELELRCSIVTNETLDLLSTVKFKSLKSLTLRTGDVIESTTAGQALTRLLINVRDTLEQLTLRVTIVLDAEVDNPVGSSITIESLPEMPSLKRLKIACSLVLDQGSIDFLQNFPKLEKLMIWDQDRDNFSLRLRSVDKNFKHNSLRVLKMPRNPLRDRPTTQFNAQHQIETLRFIVTCFPRLEVLSIVLQDFEHEPEHLSTSLRILNELTELQGLSIYHVGVSDDDFNEIMSKMFISNDLAFCGLKRFRFYSFCRLWLYVSTFGENLNYAQSLQCMELCNFQILETEKDSVFEAVKKINRVRFLHCKTMTSTRLRNNNQPPRKRTDIHDNEDSEDSEDEDFFENVMHGEKNVNDKYFDDWKFEVGTSIDAAPDLSL